MRQRTIQVLLVAVILLGLGRSLVWLRESGSDRLSITTLVEPLPVQPSSELAYDESYRNALAGKLRAERTACWACHPNMQGYDPSRVRALGLRANFTRTDWAEDLNLPARCGACHRLPDPATLPARSWSQVIQRMHEIMDLRKVAKPTEMEWVDLLHFYYTFSREAQRPLEPDPDPARSALRFEAGTLGVPPAGHPRELAVFGQVSIVDLDQDGLPDVLTSDIQHSSVLWVHRVHGAWQEDSLAEVPFPARAQPVTTAPPGRPKDIVVASLGDIPPSDKLLGSVVLLVNDGAMHFTPRTILHGMCRVADVQPGDFNGDGAVDFVVAAYGHINEGEVGWLENLKDGTYAYHRVVKKAGAISAIPVDIDGDGHLDFVVLFAQENEEISAFINDGRGGFSEHVLFKAATPSFGSSSIQLVDLDQDGDLDILYTNGDNMDLPTIVPRPFHGVQWLENQGGLNFVWHDIQRFYGAYSAVVADMNHDGKPDIVVASMFNDWADPTRDSLIWLENDGHQHFTARGIARQPIHLISAAVGDLDGDGWNDIVATSMNLFPPFERAGRLTRWRNLHYAPR